MNNNLIKNMSIVAIAVLGISSVVLAEEVVAEKVVASANSVVVADTVKFFGEFEEAKDTWEFSKGKPSKEGSADEFRLAVKENPEKFIKEMDECSEEERENRPV